VGRPIQIDGAVTTVVGVLPRDFSVPWGTFEVYLPLGLPGLQVVAKLRSGVTLAAARTEMASIMQRLAAHSRSRIATRVPF
jgi:hypothetical protein